MIIIQAHDGTFHPVMILNMEITYSALFLEGNVYEKIQLLKNNSILLSLRARFASLLVRILSSRTVQFKTLRCCITLPLCIHSKAMSVT